MEQIFLLSSQNSEYSLCKEFMKFLVAGTLFFIPCYLITTSLHAMGYQTCLHECHNQGLEKLYSLVVSANVDSDHEEHNQDGDNQSHHNQKADDHQPILEPVVVPTNPYIVFSNDSFLIDLDSELKVFTELPSAKILAKISKYLTNYRTIPDVQLNSLKSVRLLC